jgi:uncharacterized protein YjbI with pentapeptide repeats
MKKLLISIVMLVTIIGCGNNNPDLVKLKETNECIGCDLAGVNLKEAQLSKANLSGANLSGAKFTDTNLSGANLSGANLSGAKFTDTNLSGANLSDANFTDTKFIQVNLSAANLNGTNFSNADFNFKGYTTLTNIKYGKANFSGAKLNYKFLNNSDFTQADFSGADLSHAYLTHTSFNAAILVNTNLSGAGLEGTDFKGSLLSNTNLDGTKMKDVDFSRALLFDVDFTTAELKGKLPKIANAIFCNTKMSDGIKNDDCKTDIKEHLQITLSFLDEWSKKHSFEYEQRKIRRQEIKNEIRVEKYGNGIYAPARYKKRDSNSLYANDWKTLCNKIDGYTTYFKNSIANDINGIVTNQFSTLVSNGAYIQSNGFRTVKKDTDDSIVCFMSAKVSGMLNGSTITKEERIYISQISVSGDNVLAHYSGSPYAPPYAMVAP